MRSSYENIDLIICVIERHSSFRTKCVKLKNKYLEAGNYDPLGYISLNKILKKITCMFMKQNYGNSFQLVKGCFALMCIRCYKLNGKTSNIDAPSNSLKDSNVSRKVKTTKKRVWGTLLNLQHFKGKRGMLELQDGV